MKADNLRTLMMTGLFLFLTLPVLSEEDIRYYDIELVIFENLEETTDINEIWPAGKQLQIPENAAVLGRKYEGSLPAKYDPRFLFNTLPVNDYRLKEQVEAIKASEQYRLLLHTGWRQPGLPKQEAVTIYFNHAIAEQGGDTPATGETADKAAGMNVATAQAESLSSLPAGIVANLEGLVTVVLSRYLHLDVEMLYKKEPNKDTVDMFDSSFLEDRRGQESQFYLQQNRRMRSKETHYIDHPIFSMLVRITPHEVVSTVAPVTTGARTH